MPASHYLDRAPNEFHAGFEFDPVHIEMAGKSAVRAVQAAHSHREIVETFEPAITSRAYQHTGVETLEADDTILASVGANVPRRAEVADGKRKPRETNCKTTSIEIEH